MINIIFTEKTNTTFAKTTPLTQNEKQEAFSLLEQTISSQNYQRISNFKIKNLEENKIEIYCEVVKLNNKTLTLNEDINLPFVNDENVVGKWQTIGEFITKEDFLTNKNPNTQIYGQNIKDIYFLPNGENYWCYSWTKGKFLIDDGISTYVNNYKTEKINNENYMFVDLKSYNYLRGGKTTLLVLKQVDNKPYSAFDIAKKDKIDLPFVNDEKIIGEWKAFSFCENKNEFIAKLENNLVEKPNFKLFWNKVSFYPNGKVVSVYDKELIEGNNKQVWTKGYLLRKWNNSACAYEIHSINNVEYLIIEWKSGNYRWGGFETDYYVFVRN